MSYIFEMIFGVACGFVTGILTPLLAKETLRSIGLQMAGGATLGGIAGIIGGTAGQNNQPGVAHKPSYAGLIAGASGGFIGAFFSAGIVQFVQGLFR